MTDQYQKLMNLWKAGKFPDAIIYFGQRMLEGLLGQNKTESFNQNLAKFLELVEAECEKESRSPI